MPKRGSGWYRDASVWTVVGLAVVLVGPMVGRVLLAYHLSAHPDQIAWWGYSAPVAGFTAWFILVVGTRLSTERDDEQRPPQGKVTSRAKAFWIIGVIVLVGTMLLEGSMLSKHGRDLTDAFPELKQAVALGSLGALAAAVAVWVLLAVLPAMVASTGRRSRQELVDAVVDLGGVNSVRVLYRPVFSLGGVVTVTVDGKTQFPLSPGQAVGLLAPDGALTIEFPRPPRMGLRKGEGARLDLAQGEGSELIYRSGALPRLTHRRIDGEVAFETATWPFVSLWVGPGGMGPRLGGRPPSRLSVREDHAERAAGPSMQAPAWHGPWWQRLWWPVWVAAGSAGALSLLLQSLGIADRGLSFTAMLLTVAAAPLIPVVAWLDRRRRAVGLAPWSAPLPWILAVLVGLSLVWSGAWVTGWVLVFIGGPALVAARTVGAMRAQRRARRASAGARDLVWMPDRERLEFWRALPDAVRDLALDAPLKASSGYVRVVPVTALRAGSIVAVGQGWTAPVRVDPVGVRLRAGTYALRVERGKRRHETPITVVGGHVTEVRVGVVPWGLQWTRPLGRMVVQVQPAWEGRLVVDAALPREPGVPPRGARDDDAQAPDE